MFMDDQAYQQWQQVKTMFALIKVVFLFKIAVIISLLFCAH